MILDPTDQNIRDQGFNFVPFDRYLASPFQPKTLDMSGGISTLQPPIIPPIIPQGDGGGGGGPNIGPAPDTSGFDYETDAYGVDDFSAKDKGLTEEEDEALGNLTNPGLTKGMMGTLTGTVLGFLNPFTAMASLAYQSKKQKEALEEKAREAAAKADFDRAMKQGRDFYDTLNDGRGASVSDKSREEAGTGFSDVSESGPFADGGRVGYMMGGLADLVDIYD